MRAISGLALVLGLTALASANRLYGWTDATGGYCQAVTIDETTGEAIAIATIPVPSGFSPYSLTFDPVSKRFYGVGLGAGTAPPSKLASINPQNGQVDWLDIVGYPSGLVYFEGLEYTAKDGSLVASFTNVGSYLTTRMAKVSSLGTMTAYTADLPYADADMLGCDANGGSLYIFDINNPTGGNSLNRIDSPFGSATVTGIYHGPANVDSDSDLCVIPGTGTFYVTRGDRLVRLDVASQTMVEIGSYGLGIPPVRGIAAVEKPMTVISGKATLEDYAGRIDDKFLTMQLLSGGSVVDWLEAPLSADGSFTVFADHPGTYSVRVWVGGWLSKSLGELTINGTRIKGLAVSVVNGDIDRDNAVTVFDYNALSSYFDKTADDADWTVPRDGVSPKDADLDGDGAVTVFDYNILSKNFDLVGD